MVRSRRYRWQLNGLLFGAAVGAGFAGFESAGYALRALGGGWGAVLDSITIRALLSPGGHVIWTAMVGSALWRVKGGRPFAASMLLHRDVMRRWGIAVVLHGMWDADLIVHPYLKMSVLLAVGWYIVLAILKQALAEVEDAKGADVAA
jgi:RsiW-degrading membrane proteinase PrsW (M82 family)